MDPIIITGMHRSGTSAVARLVQNLGFDIGSNLLPAANSNRHGHFEEMIFLDLHDQMIARHFSERAPFCDWLPLAEDREAIPYTDQERYMARAVWEGHKAAGGIAWKDPRTSLFLDLWTDILPEARVIICLRHPYQVHLSLLRRGEPALQTDYSAAIRGWQIYNERIRRTLARLSSHRFVIVDVDNDFKEPAQLAEKLAHFLGVQVPTASSESVTPGEFHFENDLEAALDAFPSFFPEIAALHRTLQGIEADESSELPTPPPFIFSDEARLIEFEEISGLRRKSRRMLIRAIAADRKRTSQFHQISADALAEKDRLIEDMSRVTEKLTEELFKRHGVGMNEPLPAPQTEPAAEA